MKYLLIFVYFAAWFWALTDLSRWKQQDFRTDIRTNEGNFFSFWIVGNVILLFIYAIRAFVRAYT